MHPPRIDIGRTAPPLYRAMRALSDATNTFAASAGIAEGFSHLLRLRASQLNGCAYCVRMHTRDALAAGETADRISVLPGWRETAYFDERERAALALIESVTRIADGQVPDAVYAQAVAALGETGTAAVEWLGVVINAWNRVAVASRYPVAP